MSKHTPGPWRAVPSGDASGRRDVISKEGYFVAEVLSGTPSPRANARLIASAPDLLAALKCADWFMEDMAKWMQPEMMTPEQYNKIKWAIEAAIAKATGKTP